MRAISLTKTEKKFVILLVVVAVVNFIGNIYIPFVATFYDYYGDPISSPPIWGFLGWIIEILVVVVLILMIRKE